MNVSLTPELEKLVNQKVGSGLYNSASEVVREALRLLKEQDEIKRSRLEVLRKEIAVGLEQLDRGRSKPLDKALVERIKARGLKRVQGEKEATRRK
ncbi:MAG: type II toxin-antitoxin system ParD family antitoxin [Acidobacteria bacterium]|nr:type II toxin-antitoxin system ParD family antitoxin [Acidobacteriota bacterium]